MIALSCKHVFQSSQFYLTSLTPRLDLKPLATLEPLPSWFKQRDNWCISFGAVPKPSLGLLRKVT